MFVTSEVSYLVMCSSKKYPYPPPATEGNGKSEGRGVRKKAISEWVGGCLQKFFSRGSEYSLRTSLSIRPS